MRRVETPAHFKESLEAARREARAAFGDDRLILERYLSLIRHVEIQVFADGDGQIALFERECSVQRRHQKIIEESPSTAVSPELRDRMGAAAVELARLVGYRGAGTVEFVVDEAGAFYFLEMNTRLQVEHPVTEMITGLDLVHLQIREAMGESVVSDLSLSGISLSGPHGHAIECRIYAEDPAQGFLPSTGKVLALELPHGPGIRFDSGIEAGSEIGIHYDPILAKLVVHAPTRPAAIARLCQALAETVILGVQTNLSFLRAVIEHPEFARGETYTDFVPRHLPEWSRSMEVEPVELAVAALLSLDPAASDRGSEGKLREAAGLGDDPFSPWNRFSNFRLSSGADSASAVRSRSGT
jgi:acetyl/propionyl-CoA carboxylase alpha subunit